MLSFNNILTFNPHDYKYNIPVINSKLQHYFVLSTISIWTLLSSEKVQHLLTIYGKTLQPETWDQWGRNQVDNFDEGNITQVQDFMNKAVIKVVRSTLSEILYLSNIFTLHMSAMK